VSTYFYLACKTCKQYAALASRSFDGVGGLAGDEWLRPFAVVHCDHEVAVLSEYSEALDVFTDVNQLCAGMPASMKAAQWAARGSRRDTT
jgi:hypothetical protein